MDRDRFALGLALATIALVFLADTTRAQYAPQRAGSSPLGSQKLAWQRPTSPKPTQKAAQPAPPAPQPAPPSPEPARVQPAMAAEPIAAPQEAIATCYECDSCGDMACPGCGFMDESITCGAPVGCGTGMYAGFEFTFVKPFSDGNVGFTTTEDDGDGNEVFTDSEFDYDLVLTPRVYLGWRRCDEIGLQVTWWQFDNEADTLTSNPPANGFGRIDHPEFGNVDIGSGTPTDVFSAASHLNAWTIDIEATKEACLGAWTIGVAGGLRYAETEQGYQAQLRNNLDELRGQIDYSQSIKGIGPTISLRAARAITPRASFFTAARGSILFGDSDRDLSAGEDLDLVNSFTTTQTNNRDDVLSIAEMQVGVQWRGAGYHHSIFRPFLSIAMEGQVWEGAGSATSDEGTLGFFGFTTQLGLDW